MSSYRFLLMLRGKGRGLVDKFTRVIRLEQLNMRYSEGERVFGEEVLGGKDYSTKGGHLFPGRVQWRASNVILRKSIPSPLSVFCWCRNKRKKPPSGGFINSFAPVYGCWQQPWEQK